MFSPVIMSFSVSFAVRNIIGISFVRGVAFSRWATSNPDISSIITSSNIRSYEFFCPNIFSTASSPDFAVSTSYPFIFKLNCNMSQMSRSSSTTSMHSFISLLFWLKVS